MLSTSCGSGLEARGDQSTSCLSTARRARRRCLRYRSPGDADFVAWSIGDQFEIFYEDLRWSGWEGVVSSLGRGEGPRAVPAARFQGSQR